MNEHNSLKRNATEIRKVFFPRHKKGAHKLGSYLKVRSGAPRRGQTGNDQLNRTAYTYSIYFITYTIRSTHPGLVIPQTFVHLLSLCPFPPIQSTVRHPELSAVRSHFCQLILFSRNYVHFYNSRIKKNAELKVNESGGWLTEGKAGRGGASGKGARENATKITVKKYTRRSTGIIYELFSLSFTLLLFFFNAIIYAHFNSRVIKWIKKKKKLPCAYNKNASTATGGGGERRTKRAQEITTKFLKHKNFYHFWSWRS